MHPNSLSRKHKELTDHSNHAVDAYTDVHTSTHKLGKTDQTKHHCTNHRIPKNEQPDFAFQVESTDLSLYSVVENDRAIPPKTAAKLVASVPNALPIAAAWASGSSQSVYRDAADCTDQPCTDYLRNSSCTPTMTHPQDKHKDEEQQHEDDLTNNVVYHPNGAVVTFFNIHQQQLQQKNSHDKHTATAQAHATTPDPWEHDDPWKGKLIIPQKNNTDMQPLTDNTTKHQSSFPQHASKADVEANISPPSELFIQHEAQQAYEQAILPYATKGGVTGFSTNKRKSAEDAKDIPPRLKKSKEDACAKQVPSGQQKAACNFPCFSPILRHQRTQQAALPHR